MALLLYLYRPVAPCGKFPCDGSLLHVLGGLSPQAPEDGTFVLLDKHLGGRVTRPNIQLAVEASSEQIRFQFPFLWLPAALFALKPLA